MPPKKANSSSSKSLKNESKSENKITDFEKNSISSMFAKIKSKDQELRECNQCNEKMKSCLFNDHLKNKCKNVKSEQNRCNQDDIIILDSDDDQNSNNEKIANSNEIIKSKLFTSKSKSIQINDGNKDDKDLIISSLKTINKESSNSFLNEKNEIDNLCEPKLKRYKSSSDQVHVNNNSEDESELINFLDNMNDKDLKIIKNTPIKNDETFATEKHLQNQDDFDYYLSNFMKALEAVISEPTFSCLLNEFDMQTIDIFASLKKQSKILYVRLFQRKFKWHNVENIIYEKISNDLSEFLSELFQKSFLIDENSIDSYEEVLYQLKAPQLKELAKICHVTNFTNQTFKSRADTIKLILQHFKTQKSLLFNFNDKKNKNQNHLNEISNKIKPQFMNQCKKILGKCYKLNRASRDVFSRILMLYCLSSTHHVEQKEAGQQQLHKILMVNLGKVKFMDYEIKLDTKIFRDRDALLSYQNSLEVELEMLSFIEAKEFDLAVLKYEDKRIEEFKEIILNEQLNDYNSKLPIYLRVYTCSSIYCKLLSIFATEILQKIRKYKEANDLFEFLLFKQSLYLQTSRPKWFERMALNYETHLKDPIKSFEILTIGLKDQEYVKRAGRLTLYQRLTKMSQTKRYFKINELKERLTNCCITEKFDFQEAPTVEIEGIILHSEFIPGRKNIFIQNFELDDNKGIVNNEESSNSSSDIFKINEFKDESDSNQDANLGSSQQIVKKQSDTLVKNRYSISVEQVALTHYIKKLGFDKGKHGETSSITTLFGLLFWNIIFDTTVNNVFIDKFQSVPLDLQTDYFYLNRKEKIDSKLELLDNSSIDFVCEMISECWNTYKGVECSLVSWTLFDDLEEFLSLVRCFTCKQLTSLTRFMCQNFRYCRSGGPDLLVWSIKSNKCKFVEVKGPGDRLSYKQMMWLDFMLKNSIDCEVCYVKGQNSKRLRESIE